MLAMTVGLLTWPSRLVLILSPSLVRQYLVKLVLMSPMPRKPGYILLFQRRLNVLRVENVFLKTVRRPLLKMVVRLVLSQFLLMLFWIESINPLSWPTVSQLLSVRSVLLRCATSSRSF